MTYKLVDYFPGVRTSDELLEVLNELKRLSDSVYKIDDWDFVSVLNKGVRKITADILREIIDKEAMGNKKDQIAYLLNELINSVNDIQKMNITLAIEPTDNLVNQIVKWMANNLGVGVIADFTYDPSIIAGVVISYQGKILDYSWEKHWKNVWQQVGKELNYGD